MKISNKKYYIFLILPLLIFATNFDELDKAPEGVYKGQILFGGAIGLGVPFGNAVDAETEFIEGTTFTFTENEITKEVDLVHLSFLTSFYAEYLPIDHVGIRVMADYLSIYQRTTFGSELANKNEVLYFHYGVSVGPNFHLTVRKPWDVSFFPFVGYSIGKYTAGCVAKELFPEFTEDTVTNSNAIIFGTELATTFYFSGGVFFSLSANWISCPVTPVKPLKRDAPAPAAEYDTPDSISSVNILLSFGYAYYN